MQTVILKIIKHSATALILLMLSFTLFGNDVYPEQDSNLLQARVPETIQPGNRLDPQPEPAKGKLLVASRRLKGSIFEKSVILLIDYSWESVTGLIINQPADVKLTKIFPELKKLRHPDDNIFIGGPVDIRRIYVLIKSEDKPRYAVPVIDDLYVTMSMSELKKTVNSKKGDKFRIYSGYAGWDAGQLDSEIMRGSWNVMDGNAETIFSSDTSKLWKILINRKTIRVENMPVENNHSAGNMMISPVSYQARFDVRLQSNFDCM